MATRSETLLRDGGEIYGGSARFDDQQRAMTEEELYKAAPSIFASEAHSSRSERFAPIPTIEVLRRIAEEGFMPVGAKQMATADPVRNFFTKHVIRLRKLDDVDRSVGDNVFEMLLRNANDGTAAYHLMAGLWRVRCMNSLVAHTRTFSEVTIRHTGDAPTEVLRASNRVLELSGRILGAADAWGQIELDEPERLAFAQKAHQLRWLNKIFGVASALEPPRLLEHRRDGDKGHDLWTTFNVVQENLIKGGQEGNGRDSAGRNCTYRSRPVNGIDADVTLNTALWGLADELATKHGAQV